MPRFEVTAPDGSRHEVTAPEGASEQDAISYVQRTYTPADVPRIEIQGTSADEPKSLRDTIIDAASTVGEGAKRFGGGAVTGAQNLGAGLVKGAGHLGNVVAAPFQLGQDYLQGNPLGTAHRVASETINADTARMAADPESLNFGVGSATPEMVISGGPIASVGTRIATQLPALGRYAPAVGDILANAGYAGGKAEVTGGDTEQSMLEGGGGAAAGRVLVRTLGGIKPLLSEGAQALADRGITLTPGQMFGKVGMAAEDLAANLPFIGGTIDRARARAASQYSRAEVNRAVEGIPGSTKKMGEDAVAEANKFIDDAYERVKSRVSLPSDAGEQAIREAGQAVQAMPMLDPQQVARVGGYVEQRIWPHIRRGTVDGDTFKVIDSDLGKLIRQYRSSSNAADQHMGDAFAEVQFRLRHALQGSDATAKAELAAVNTAYRNMIPVEDAARRAAGKIGEFTPTQMAQASHRTGIKLEGEAEALNRAGRELITSNRPLARTLARVGIGTGGGAAAGIAHMAGVPGAGATAAIAAGGIAATKIAAELAYNRPALDFVIHGLSMSPRVPPNVSRDIANMNPVQAAEHIRLMSEKLPSFAQVVSQLGRAYASQQGETQ
ncbi:hypothetical protein QTI24_26650 [Variovorax sp. J22P240]|uniref:hypothetical protein n=1 Tax=Variovorax sp. J22P240 TaxID=3053514 RepID=UPI00257905B3|nr:hypothetical protein [Variovorax sp. J22P240]MDM0002213.1 hypothetical protein [Variovorax sp. J22P240]